MNTSLEKLIPRLKVGTLVLPRGERTFIGRTDFGIEIDLPGAMSILGGMNGRNNCQEISEAFGVEMEEIGYLISQLDQAHLIDTESTTISVQRFHSLNPTRTTHAGDDSNDGAFKQLQTKLSPELNFTTWFHNVKDGGVSLVGHRRDWEIAVLGNSRIATLVYGILLASGATETSFTAIKNSPTISDRDLTAGFLRNSDIGQGLQTRTDEMARELSLFPRPQTSEKKKTPPSRKLIICVGNPPSEHVQEWMSDGVAHLLVENPDCASINVGPLVLPGKTPCLRCLSLTKEDQEGLWREINRQNISVKPAEVPVAVAHHVAGFIALEILQFLDIGQTELIGHSARINYHSPGRTQSTLLARHPACGCNW